MCHLDQDLDLGALITTNLRDISHCSHEPFKSVHLWLRVPGGDLFWDDWRPCTLRQAVVNGAQERGSADEDQLTTQISQTTFQISFGSNTTGRGVIEPGADDQPFLIDDMSVFPVGSIRDVVHRTSGPGAIVDWMLGALMLTLERDVEQLVTRGESCKMKWKQRQQNAKDI